MLVGCGDDDDGTPGGVAGSSVGGSSAGKSSTAGTDTGGSDEGGKGGSFGMAGTDAGGKGGTDAGGTGGTGGTPATECTTAIDCFDDFNPCTTAACENGKCVHNPDDDATCDDSNGCTDDKCVDGECKSTNNTAACDDNNQCTSTDKCVDGVCKGTNNTAVCDDLSTCTTDDKCSNGLCSGTRNTTACPVCATPDNMIKNCDFTSMLDNWATSISFDGGVANQSVVNEHNQVDVISGGGQLYSVQPRQEPLALKQGFKYKFGLVAGSDVPRDGAVALTQAAGMYKVYSAGDSDAGGFKIALEPQMKPFNFEFFMMDPDDANVKLEIKVGGPDATANKTYFDDVYVREIKCAAPADCDDKNPCTTDACNATTGQCTWTNNTDPCATDNESCTVDVCEAGVCKHNPKAENAGCDDDANDCTTDVCKAGVCSHPSAPTCVCTVAADCDDLDPCTTDTCGAGGACEHTANTAMCDDGNSCTNDDVCGGGAGGICGGVNACFADCATGNLIKDCDMAVTPNVDWQLYTAAGGATMTFADGVLKANVTVNNSTNDYDMQVLQGGVILAKAETTYRIKLNATATAARKIFVGFTRNGGDYGNIAGQVFDVTTKMGQIQFDYKTPAGWTQPGVGIKLEIRIAGPTLNPTVPNTLSLDNVSITEVATP